MHLQFTPSCVLSTTGITFVGFLPSVDTDMCVQMATC
ncbi:hypothetical protein NP493_438g00000 [Ridgeia piscesae]|uniref:Uncharacterized protein n=1 Tax=Ridgeia piscesae TaxID=27915 RepID=A0AAD9NTX6_RIDPI|nr:hypothetical protein NP493_438g00000 [Ridgeia piscesae]